MTKISHRKKSNQKKFVSFKVTQLTSFVESLFLLDPLEKLSTFHTKKEQNVVIKYCTTRELTSPVIYGSEQQIARTVLFSFSQSIIPKIAMVMSANKVVLVVMEMNNQGTNTFTESRLDCYIDNKKRCHHESCDTLT